MSYFISDAVNWIHQRSFYISTKSEYKELISSPFTSGWQKLWRVVNISQMQRVVEQSAFLSRELIFLISRQLNEESAGSYRNLESYTNKDVVLGLR